MHGSTTGNNSMKDYKTAKDYPIAMQVPLVTEGADMEIDTLGGCLYLIERLPPEAQRRVAAYLLERASKQV